MEKTSKVTQSGNKHKKTIALILAAMLFLVVGFGLYNIPCPSTAQFFYFRTLLALAASLATVALLSGTIRLKLTFVTAGGSLAVFVFIFYLAPTISNNSNHCTENFNFKVFLRDSLGQRQAITNSFLSITVEGREDKVRIQENGTALFELIPSSFRDSIVLILLEMDGWIFNNKKPTISVKLKGNYTTLLVQPDETRCCVSGSIRNYRNRYVEGVTVRIGAQSTHSDKDGRFQIKIPKEEQKNSYKVSLEKSGVVLLEQYINPRTMQENEFILPDFKNN